MNAIEKQVYQALMASGWPDSEVKTNESLVDLGLDSLALALWVSELERQCQLRIPFELLSLEQWETIEKAANLLEPVFKEQKR
jgi:acyl carrier protein